MFVNYDGTRDVSTFSALFFMNLQNSLYEYVIENETFPNISRTYYYENENLIFIIFSFEI